MKYLFLLLFCVPVFAQNKPSFLMGGKDCSNGLSEALKDPKVSTETLQKEYAMALSCIDSCYTEEDTSYLASQCMDWDQIQNLIHEKSSISSIVSMILQNSFNKCSVESLRNAKNIGNLSGSYFDPRIGQCSKVEKANSFISATYNNLMISGLFIFQYVQSKDRGSPIVSWPGARIEERGFHQNKGALYTWNFKANLSASYGSLNSGRTDEMVASFEALAELEGGVYKTFGKKNCKPLLGIVEQGSAHAVLGYKDRLYDTKALDNSGGLINTGSNDPKVLDTAIKAAFGFVCSYDNYIPEHSRLNPSSLLYRLELQGDLLRVSLFQNIQPNQGLAFAYNHAGKQINLTGSIHHNDNANFKPYLEGSIGVGNYSFPKTNSMGAFNVLDTSLRAEVGGEGGHFKIGGETKLEDLNWKDPLNNQNRNIFAFYAGFLVGGMFDL